MRSRVFLLWPDSHFAHEQFRNCTAQSKNSYFTRQSENSHFAQDNSGIVPILTLRRTYIFNPSKRTVGHCAKKKKRERKRKIWNVKTFEVLLQKIPKHQLNTSFVT